MKANSRRRVLISSMAMLLVALVALSTATYAWFTQSTTANASNITVKTIKASSLQISDKSKSWGTTVDYKTNATYLPVSSADGTAWYTASAAKADAITADPTTVAAGTTYFKDQLNVRNNGTADVQDVQVTMTLKETNKIEYLRVALVPVSDDDTNTGKIATVDATAFAGHIYDTTKEKYSALNKNSVVGTSIDVTEITCADNFAVGADDEGNVIYTLTLDLGDNGVIAGKATEDALATSYYYNLYVWYEGQDAQCLDANAGASIGNIDFVVTGNTANQV